MSSSSLSAESSDPRLDSLLADLLDAQQRGERPSLDAWIERHPDFEKPLRAFWSDWQAFHHAAPQDDSPDDSREELPRQIGDYVLLRKIAAGGMGVVYEARQESLRRAVAIKMLAPGIGASEERVRRLKREAELIAKLEHEGIVPIYEVGEHRGFPYYVMRYLSGGTLADRLLQGPFAPREAARIVRDMALALDYAHRQQVVHRDVKPSNVLFDISSDGAPQPRLADFGLAKCLSEDVALTRSGQILGTLSYVAPEQTVGDERLIGPAVDVYSAGAVLYCLLTGRPPFQSADPVETLRQVRNDEPLPPSRLNPAVPRDLETIALRCLEKSPERRLASAAELAAELDRFLAGRPIRSRPMTRGELVARWIRRNPLVASLTAALVVVGFAALLAGAALLVEQSGLARREQQRRQELERVYFVSLIRQADLEWQAGNINRASELLEECPLGLRHWEWQFLVSRVRAERLSLAGHGVSVRQVVYSPDRRRLATGGIDHTIRVWNADSGQEEARWEVESPVMALDWSRDGRRIAAGTDDGQVLVWDIKHAARPLAWRRMAHPGGANQVRFSADSRTVVSGGNDGKVQLLDGNSGEFRHALETGLASVLAIAVEPNGPRIAVGGEGAPEVAGSELLVWDPTSTSPAQRWPIASGKTSAVLLVDDSRRLCWVDEQGHIHVWDVTTGQETQSYAEHEASVTSLALDPSGQFVASGDRNGVIHLWDFETGDSARHWQAHHLAVLGLDFRVDSGDLASCGLDGHVRVWDWRDSKTNPEIRAHRERINELAVSADGEWLASASKDESVRLWRAATGELLGEYSGHSAMVLAVAFAPRGQWLVSADEHGEVHRWSSDSFAAIEGAWNEPAAVWSVAVHPSSSAVAIARADGVVGVRRTDHSKASWERPAHAGAVRCVRYHPSGAWLVSSGDDGSIRWWDAPTGEPLGELAVGGGPIWGLAFSLDGHRLAAVCSDGGARVWEWGPRLTEPIVLRGHTGVVYAAAFSPDSRRLVTSGFDRSVKLWDLDSNQEVLTLREASWSVNSVVFARGGRTIAAGGSNWRIHLWHASDEP